MPKPTQALILFVLLAICLAEPVAALPGVPQSQETFAGRAMRFDLPSGFHVLEAMDGGCFVYHDSTPGFLALYPTDTPPDEMLAELLAATADVRRVETPLEVDVDSRTFAGLFVETADGSRLFLAAAEGWGLVAQGATSDWPSLAGDFNHVLRTMTFVED